MILTVDCVSELAYADTTDAEPERNVVEGSEYTEEGFVYYRPQLTMMVMDYRTSYNEYGVEVNWSLELEEV